MQTQLKTQKTPPIEQIWRFKAGSTWNGIISAFCEKKGIPATDTKQIIDLDIWTPRETYAIECKKDDMHSSLFPTSPTSLEAELKKYIVQPHDHKVLVYVHNGMDEKDLINLDRIMFKFPTVLRKSYMSQLKAVEGIYRMVSKGIPRTNLSEPTYFSADLGNTLANQLERIPGLFSEKAFELSELLKHNPFNIYNTWEPGLTNILRTVYPDLKNGDYHHMVNVLYDYYRGGVEPRKKKQYGEK